MQWTTLYQWMNRRIFSRGEVSRTFFKMIHRSQIDGDIIITSAGVWADSAYRSVESLEWLAEPGYREHL
ncbi:hypothetical protein JXA32_07390 [Candidatus Sumerlaeota bacterium]|nr:hypothetical protein [Candidatus Sumerlaeota bacterium]